MKRILILLTGICFALTAVAQDTTSVEKSDTIRVGSMIIIKRGNGRQDSERRDNNITITNRRRNYKRSNVTTNWMILDLGVSRFDDKTDYTKSEIQNPATGFAPGLNKDHFKLRNKSINVNIWFFMQELNVVKHVVNLKYGLGVELNNYHYKSNLIYKTNPTKLIIDSSTGYSKNKLAADYLTVPFMVNFNLTPNRKKGFGFSVGASAGYLYSSRQKTKSGANGKEKVWDDFDLRPWKISYIGELQLGPVKLYGSMATKSMFEKGLDHTPYTVGIRFSN